MNTVTAASHAGCMLAALKAVYLIAHTSPAILAPRSGLPEEEQIETLTLGAWFAAKQLADLRRRRLLLLQFGGGWR